MNQTIPKSTIAIWVFLLALGGFGIFQVLADNSDDDVIVVPVETDTVFVEVENSTPEDTNKQPSLCDVCGRDILSAHGAVLLKNATEREVVIYARRHDGESDEIIRLDPQGLKMLDEVLVGNMRLRFTGDGFNEETYCRISPNTTHEMWWTVRGPEMHGQMQMHTGQYMK
jgi:hypothetical protein